jgi:hypothetical protein
MSHNRSFIKPPTPRWWTYELRVTSFMLEQRIVSVVGLTAYSTVPYHLPMRYIRGWVFSFHVSIEVSLGPFTRVPSAASHTNNTFRWVLINLLSQSVSSSKRMV